MKRVLLIGTQTPSNLESSYERAFRRLDCEVATFDVFEAISRNSRFGKLGQIFTSFVPVEAWIQKANREVLLRAIEFQPDLIVVIGGHPIRVGSLSQMKIACPGVTLAFVWPDTMLNLTGTLVECLPLFDVVGTYSQSSVPLMQALGAPHTFWLPLGADEDLHGKPAEEKAAQRDCEIDVAFIGGWRSDREATLSKLTDFNVKIWGPEWDRHCKGNSFIMKAWEGKPLRGQDYAEAIRSSKINLNVIDPTNYPSPNMRYFEIPVAGGLQLSSTCPELESEFQNGEQIVYYKDPDDLPELVGSLIADPERRFRIADAGHALVTEKHTYVHRANALLRECDSLNSQTATEAKLSSAPLFP